MTTETLVKAYTSGKFAPFNEGSRQFYGDKSMLLYAKGNPFTGINFYDAHTAVRNLKIDGVHCVTDREYNAMVSADSEIANQMRRYAVWTSILKDVEVDAKSGGYTAKHIARPEVSIVDGGYVAKGRTKAIKLPKDGFFKIRELLESDTGLPTKTYGDYLLDEPCAYWIAAAGKERPVSRGDWYLGGRREFRAAASWEQFDSRVSVGVRVASDKPIEPIVLAGLDAVGDIEKIAQRYSLTPAEVVAELGRRL